MTWLESQHEMSKEDFRLLRDLIYTYCGIFFHDDVRYIFERRIGARMRELGLATHQDYYRHLRYHPKRRTELEEIVELLTTNETYFFREEYQLRAFSEEILPELIERNASRRRLRVWSAGCSTGEEVYTVGILLRENRKLDGWNLEVFGNDISRKVLQVARKGIYGKNAFRVMEPYYLKHYFHPVGNSYAVDESLRSLVSFGYLNLLDGEMLQLVGEVDVVFCRNVLIYFDASARIRVLATFHDKLRRGGYLLLGHSESLVNVSTDFELVHLVNDMVYRKACTDLELGRSA